MKRKLLVIYTFLVLICLYADGDSVLNYETLDGFFDGSKFVVLEETLLLPDRNLLVAVHYLKENQGIFDKAIVYESAGEDLRIHLLIQDKCIIDKNNDTIVDLREWEDFYGFSIVFAYPTDPAYAIGFEFRGYFDGGRIPADPPIGIDWDPEKEIFHEFVLNWDEL